MRRALTALVVVLSAVVYASPSLSAAGPLINLAFNDGSGTTATDTSGNGTNGTLLNGPAWTTGKSGGALNFDGSNDLVFVNNSTALNTVANAVTVAAWVYRNTNQSGDVSVVSRQRGVTYYEHYYLGFHNGSYRWFVNTSSGYSDTNIGGAAPVGQWVHMVGTYDGTDVKLYVNGVQQFSTPASGRLFADTTGLTIGASHNDSARAPEEAFNGKLDEVGVYAYALTAQEVSQLYQASGGTATAPPVTTPAPPVTTPSAPLVRLAIDEGSGLSTADSSGNGNNATLQNGATWTAGKSGQAVNLDGKDDTLFIPNSATVNAAPAAVTVSAWVYRNVNQAGNVAVLSRQKGTSYYEHYYLGFQDGQYRWFVAPSGGYSNTNLGGAAPLAQWVHMVGTYDGATAKLYVNGALQYSTPASGTFATDTTGIVIGANHNTASRGAEEAFNGKVDAVTIYGYALSAAEVTQLYQATGTATTTPPVVTPPVVTPPVVTPPVVTTPAPTGLMAHYAADEGSGTSVADNSGNGNNATLQNGATWTTGASGKAISFDGKDDTLVIPNSASINPTNAVTVAAWVYRNANQAGDVSVVSRQKGTSYYEHYYLGFHDNQYRWFVAPSGGYSNTNLGGAAPLAQWVHLVGTYDGSTVKLYANGVLQYSTPASGTFASDTTGITIGASHNTAARGAEEPFNGKVDEVSLYAYALSATEVTQLYQATASGIATPPPVVVTPPVVTPPVVTPPAPTTGLISHLAIDEGSGASTADTSGNANHGTLQNGATWTPGRSGQAVNLDGKDDTVFIANSASLNVTNAITVAAWVYRSANKAGDVSVVSRQKGTSYYEHFYLGFHDNQYRWFVAPSGGYSNLNLGGAAPLGQWIHMVGTYDGSSAKLYANGVLQFSTPASGTFASDTTGITIGASHNAASRVAEEAFPGKVDEFNLYNYALSAQQVAELYLATTSQPDVTGGGSGSGTPAAPVGVAFTPSADHDTAVSYYKVDLHRDVDAQTVTPVALLDIGKPTPVSGTIQVDISSAVSPLPLGSYYVVVTAVGAGGSSAGALSPVFAK